MDERLINLDWSHLTLLAMVYFGIMGYKNGWQRSLVSLIALVFAWFVAIKTTDFMISAIYFLFELDLSGETTRDLFQIILYFAAVIMVVVTFNSKVISPTPKDNRDRLSGVSTGLLNGYLFILLWLDLGRDWMAAHVPGGNLLDFASSLSLTGHGSETAIRINFTNNPYISYNQLSQVENLIYLFLLLVFFHGFLFSFLGQADKRLRPKKS